MSSENQVGGKRGQSVQPPNGQHGQPDEGQSGQPDGGQPGQPDDGQPGQQTSAQNECTSGGISSGDKIITLQSLQKEIENLRAELTEERKRRISLETIVTRPKVAFYARVSTPIVGIAPWATIVFSDVETNIGGAYNSKTGEFVAPTAGLYVFFCTILSGWNLIIESVLQVNGTNKMHIYSGSNFQGSGSNRALLQLNTGDVVRMAKHGPWGSKPFTVHNCWSTFSGYLL
ncbi:multimerin-1-like [Mercenaria mercenaria]|uniref:multimerin-1-like n=1 Tax=Mercenaria mercenaria TaxID=6596 RepID=UPI001E1D48CF|nr:multimerin-1-like [Mercenaria mercenaria]